MANTQITIDVFRAEDMCVIDGVLTGETLGFADELVWTISMRWRRHPRRCRWIW